MSDQIPDGPPIPMSQFTLGPRYGSEDMRRDFPELFPGDKIAIECNGVTYTSTLRSVSYSSGSGDIRRRVRWWERFVPARWRKPVVVRAAVPASVTVNTDESPDVARRALARLAEMKRVIDGLVK